MAVIDLRSDTLTRPTRAMREAMLDARVGDDVYGEDPTVAELEARVADLIGHEAGLFMATGSLTNQIGVALHVAPGSEVLCDVRAHIVRAEMGAHGALHGVTMRTWVTPDGIATPEAVVPLIETDGGPFLVSTSCVALENTHNFAGGTITPIEAIGAISSAARARGVKMHLDGARLANAHIATGVSFAEYGRHFDTVSLCLSKGLGAPIGSVLTGSASDIARARVLRKRLGAGWRQAGMLAAAGLYALDHHVERLADDHEAARRFAAAVDAAAPGAASEPASNIVVVDTGERSGAEVAALAAERGVAVSALGARMVRAVTHLDVDADACERAGEIVGDVLARR